MDSRESKQYIAGITLADLRAAWVAARPDRRRYFERRVIEELARSWHRSDKSVRNTLGILRRIHSGRAPTAADSSSLHKMTPAERAFVFTGEWPAPAAAVPPPPGQLLLPPTRVLVAPDTLRDWFAGQAIAGYAIAIASGDEPEVVAAAYRIADAMLAARAEGSR